MSEDTFSRALLTSYVWDIHIDALNDADQAALENQATATTRVSEKSRTVKAIRPLVAILNFLAISSPP